MKSERAGFTLIELVVSLSLIAILVAVALPRYVALQSQARVAKTLSIFGGVRSAAALAHAKVLATHTSTGIATTIDMEGQPIDIINGYPTANAKGIIAATQINTAIDRITLIGGGQTAGDLLAIDINGGTAGNCTINGYCVPTDPATCEEYEGVVGSCTLGM